MAIAVGACDSCNKSLMTETYPLCGFCDTCIEKYKLKTLVIQLTKNPEEFNGLDYCHDCQKYTVHAAGYCSACLEDE